MTKGVEVKPIYREEIKQGPATIFMSTHCSALDICATFAYSKVLINFICKNSLVYIPFFGMCILGGGNIPIKRKHLQSAIESLKEAARRVKKLRKNICIAPEGTRRRTLSTGSVDQLLPFKKGPFHLAKDAGASIIPVVYNGCSRLRRGYSYNEGK
jgi:1-acyl-sn-glycerol-3-phosphate acyltransferase